MYVYECPCCENRCWATNNLEEAEDSLVFVCPQCATPEGGEFVMQLMDSFTFTLFHFEPSK